MWPARSSPHGSHEAHDVSRAASAGARQAAEESRQWAWSPAWEPPALSTSPPQRSCSLSGASGPRLSSPVRPSSCRPLACCANQSVSSYFLFSLSITGTSIGAFPIHLLQDRLMEALAHSLEWDALHDGVEEPLDYKPLGIRLRDPARPQVKNRFCFQTTDRGAVRAAHVIGQDFQPGDRIGPGTFIEDDIAVGLITIRFFSALGDVDHALPHRPAVTLQGS